MTDAGLALPPFARLGDPDAAYDNRGHIPGGAEWPTRWAARAAAFRDRLGTRARLSLPYGPGERQRLDLFLPGGQPRGLVVFVHGGYWRAFGREDWSHLAAGALRRGWAVAMPGYTLAPAARIREIGAEVAQAVAQAAREIPGPIALAGHSAGGQLVTRLMARGSTLPGAVAGRVGHVLSISGVHDLRPLLATAMNRDLRLDQTEAESESPVLRHPRPKLRLTVWVGAAERPEFRRQARVLADIWLGLGALTRHVEEPGRHHFDVIEGLEDPEHPMLAALLEPLEETA